ncbi:MAG: copper amine oxidase N-terminal domain-containing protein [Oscillospiraceae bacterium]|nr:copper amine oxidase N-terminal domain-containing protein [Oscillospiraceae bacterium]
MKSKKLLSFVLVFIMLIAATTGAVMVLADTNGNGEPQNGAQVEDPNLYEDEADDSDAEDVADLQAYYVSVTGMVVSVMSVTPAADAEEMWHAQTITIEVAEDSVANLNITAGTVFPFDSIEDIEEGDTVTAYVPANAPMAMIYPPQYTVNVLVAGVPENVNYHIDRFVAWGNENYPLLAYGGGFAFAIDEDTVVVTADGNEFNFEYGNLENRRLIVIYGPSTRSIPEFATATKVIVLFEDAVPLDNGAEDVVIDATGWPIVVNGEEIEAPAAFMADDGVSIMVPVRVIAEALGFEVTWIAEDRAVEFAGMSGVAEVWARIALDSTEALQTYARRAEVTIVLPTAPVLVGGHTFVPMTAFFQDVLEMANAFAFEGRLEIQSEGERMA